MTYKQELAEKIISFVQSHPNCTRIDIEVGCEMYANSWPEVKPLLVGKVQIVRDEHKKFTYEVVK
jgi:hypothetical protein